MARYQIIVSYDGTNFQGSQRQGQRRTIQGELEKALTRIGWTGESILLAGRTDTGVHASGQVAAFDLAWDHDPGKLLKAINSKLPDDLAVRWINKVSPSFHPRFDAISRTYRYRLFFGDVRNPLDERFAWRVWPKAVDLASLANIWIGTHDFSSFGSPTSPRGSTTRKVSRCEWELKGEEWLFEIAADAFLFRMVRRLVYVQVAVGQGRVETGDLVSALDGTAEERESARKRIPAGLAKACGLSLVHVHYDDQVLILID